LRPVPPAAAPPDRLVVAAGPPVRVSVRHHGARPTAAPVAARHRRAPAPVVRPGPRHRPAVAETVHRPARPATPHPTTPRHPTPAPGGGGVGAPAACGLVHADDRDAPGAPGLDLISVVPATAAAGHATAGRRPGSTPD
jgi:hypothetical protein